MIAVMLPPMSAGSAWLRTPPTYRPIAAVRADHPMARNDHGQRVAGTGGADGTDGAWVARWLRRPPRSSRVCPYPMSRRCVDHLAAEALRQPQIERQVELRAACLRSTRRARRAAPSSRAGARMIRGLTLSASASRTAAWPSLRTPRAPDPAASPPAAVTRAGCPASGTRRPAGPRARRRLRAEACSPAGSAVSSSRNASSTLVGRMSVRSIDGVPCRDQIFLDDLMPSAAALRAAAGVLPSSSRRSRRAAVRPGSGRRRPGVVCPAAPRAPPTGPDRRPRRPGVLVRFGKRLGRHGCPRDACVPRRWPFGGRSSPATPRRSRPGAGQGRRASRRETSPTRRRRRRRGPSTARQTRSTIGPYSATIVLERLHTHIL